MVGLFRRTENNQAGTGLSTWRPANAPLFGDPTETFSDLLEETLKDIYYTQEAIPEALPKMRQGGSKKLEGGRVALNFSYAA